MQHSFVIETFVNGCVTELTVTHVSGSLLLEGAYISAGFITPIHKFSKQSSFRSCIDFSCSSFP